MGLLEIFCIAVGLVLGSAICVRNSSSENGTIFGAAIGAFVGLGVATGIRQISYRLFGYRSKDKP